MGGPPRSVRPTRPSVRAVGQPPEGVRSDGSPADNWLFARILPSSAISARVSRMLASAVAMSDLSAS